MSKDYTDITLLVDRSGSMKSIKESMETALDSFIKEHRANPSTRVNLFYFDDRDDMDAKFMNVPVDHVEHIKIEPRGNTPLIDAMCKTIDYTGRRYANMPESGRPARVLFIVITDGEENASRTYKRADVFNRIRTQEDTFKWQFIYLGANQDTFKEATSYGFSWQNALKYSPDAYHIGAMASNLVGATVSYASGNESNVRGFTRSDRIGTASTEDLKKDSDGGTLETT